MFTKIYEFSIKVFACVSSVQAMVEVVGPLYHVIYLGTIDWYPGFAYCISSMILISMIVITVYCRWFVSKWSYKKTVPPMFPVDENNFHDHAKSTTKVYTNDIEYGLNHPSTLRKLEDQDI